MVRSAEEQALIERLLTELFDLLDGKEVNGMYSYGDMTPHPCEKPGCTHTVQYDDEPFCFTHSPNGGSYEPDYSYRAKQAKEEELGRRMSANEYVVMVRAERDAYDG